MGHRDVQIASPTLVSWATFKVSRVCNLKPQSRRNQTDEKNRTVDVRMPHILGKFLPDQRPVRYALRAFRGIGPAVARQVCARLHFHDSLTMGEMSERQLNALAHEVGTLKLENDLVREVRDNIARLRRIGSYRGRRHAAGLTVRGQNTQTNARTARRLNRVERSYHTMVTP